MRPDDSLERRQKCPVEPIRLHMSDGSHYDVRRPETLVVARTQIILAMYPYPDTPAEKLEYLDPLHVTRIEEINGE